MCENSLSLPTLYSPENKKDIGRKAAPIKQMLIDGKPLC